MNYFYAKNQAAFDKLRQECTSLVGFEVKKFPALVMISEGMNNTSGQLHLKVKDGKVVLDEETLKALCEVLTKLGQ